MRALALVAALALMLSACGVKGDPELPPGTPKPVKQQNTTKTTQSSN